MFFQIDLRRLIVMTLEVDIGIVVVALHESEVDDQLVKAQAADAAAGLAAVLGAAQHGQNPCLALLGAHPEHRVAGRGGEQAEEDEAREGDEVCGVEPAAAEVVDIDVLGAVGGGVDLEQAGLTEKILASYARMNEGPGAVRAEIRRNLA